MVRERASASCARPEDSPRVYLLGDANSGDYESEGPHVDFAKRSTAGVSLRSPGRGLSDQVTVTVARNRVHEDTVSSHMSVDVHE